MNMTPERHILYFFTGRDSESSVITREKPIALSQEANFTQAPSSLRLKNQHSAYGIQDGIFDSSLDTTIATDACDLSRDARAR